MATPTKREVAAAEPAPSWPPYERVPSDTERIYRKFTGAYPSIVESLLQPRPDSVMAPPCPPLPNPLAPPLFRCTRMRTPCCLS